ncbi:hypothetical protein Cus16_3020 [Curtobacterium sp. ER1/6]|nr:hypothetical protein Cus16_3020 [Curtobacterium sp. ER1/6]
MNMTCRPACPSRLTGFGVSKSAPMKTVKSRALPRMPTGQAHTRRRIPPSALSSPNTLPITSRQSTVWSPMTSCASNNHLTMPIDPPRCRASRRPGRSNGRTDLGIPWTPRPRVTPRSRLGGRDGRGRGGRGAARTGPARRRRRPPARGRRPRRGARRVRRATCRPRHPPRADDPVARAGVARRRPAARLLPRDRGAGVGDRTDHPGHGPRSPAVRLGVRGGAARVPGGGGQGELRRGRHRQPRRGAGPARRHARGCRGCPRGRRRRAGGPLVGDRRCRGAARRLPARPRRPAGRSTAGRDRLTAGQAPPSDASGPPSVPSTTRSSHSARTARSAGDSASSPSTPARRVSAAVRSARSGPAGTSSSATRTCDATAAHARSARSLRRSSSASSASSASSRIASTVPVPAAWTSRTASASRTSNRPTAATRRNRSSSACSPAATAGDPRPRRGSLMMTKRSGFARPKAIVASHPERSAATGSVPSAAPSATSAAFSAAKTVIACSATASSRPSLSPNSR